MPYRTAPPSPRADAQGVLVVVHLGEVPPAHWVLRAHFLEPSPGARADLYLTSSCPPHLSVWEVHVGEVLVALDEASTFSAGSGARASAWVPLDQLDRVIGSRLEVPDDPCAIKAACVGLEGDTSLWVFCRGTPAQALVLARLFIEAPGDP